MIQEINGKKPIISPSVFLHENAIIIGDVIIEDNSNIWPFVVIRGDIERISIGKNVSIQDGSIIHTDFGFPVTIGDNCIIGHGCILHGCKIGNNCLIAMGAIILTGAEIGNECIIGAGALVPEGKKIPDRSVVIGIPGKIVRNIEEKDLIRIKNTIETYKNLTKLYFK